MYTQNNTRYAILYQYTKLYNIEKAHATCNAAATVGCSEGLRARKQRLLAKTVWLMNLTPKLQGLSTIQYGYRKCGTHARVFSQTLAHGNSNNEI